MSHPWVLSGSRLLGLWGGRGGKKTAYILEISSDGKCKMCHEIVAKKIVECETNEQRVSAEIFGIRQSVNSVKSKHSQYFSPCCDKINKPGGMCSLPLWGPRQPLEVMVVASRFPRIHIHPPKRMTEATFHLLSPIMHPHIYPSIRFRSQLIRFKKRKPRR